MMDIDFIIVVKNQLDYTRRCVESIFRNVHQPFHLILVDNASTDDTPKYFEELKNRVSDHVQVTVIQNEMNQGWVLGINQGIESSSAPYVFFCNNDIEIYPNAVDEILSIAKQNPQFGLVNPNSNENGLKKYDEKKLKSYKGSWTELFHCFGFFVLVKRQVINAIGGFDPVFSPGYYDEMDYSERAKQAGFLSVLARAAYVYHFGSRSFLSEEKRRLFNEHRKIFDQRWGADVSYYSYFADENSIQDSLRRKEVTDCLLAIVRQRRAYIYLYIPKGARQYFEGIHIGFRPIELSILPRFLTLLIKSIRSVRHKKPISRIYVSQNRILSFWKALSFIHRAEVSCLSKTGLDNPTVN